LQHHPDNEIVALSNLQYHQHLFLKEPARTALLENIAQWMAHRLRSPK